MTTALREESGKLSWLRTMGTIWTLMCGALTVAAFVRNTDLAPNVLSMMQTGFGALVIGYISGKVTKKK